MARADAWTAVAAADAASMSAMDATTLTDAQMYQEAADAAKDAAEEQATGAGMNYMTAMDAAALAETAAGTHVLGLFTEANAYGETDEKEAAAEVASCRGGYRCSGNGGRWRPSWRSHRYCCVGLQTWKHNPEDRRCRRSARPAEDYVRFRWLLMALIRSSPPTLWAVPTATPVVKPNAKQTNVGGDFPHLFDMSSEDARVLVFTDREQDTPAVMGLPQVILVGVEVVAAEC